VLSPQYEKNAKQQKARRHQDEATKGWEVDATPDLLLKHPDAILITYKRRQMKHLNMCLKHLQKHMKKYLKTITNICNIQNIHVKHMQYLDKHTCNIRLKNR
jgi:hypothetical protein